MNLLDQSHLVLPLHTQHGQHMLDAIACLLTGDIAFSQGWYEECIGDNVIFLREQLQSQMRWLLVHCALI